MSALDTNTPKFSHEAQIGVVPEFTLVDFLRLMKVRARVIIGTTVVVVALVTILVMQMTPLYSATAVVMLDQRKNNVVENTESTLTQLPSDQVTVQNQVQILTSLELAGRVVDRQKLAQDPAFNPRANSPSSLLKYLNPLSWLPVRTKTRSDVQGEDLARKSAIHALLARLTVDPIGTSTSMKVIYQSEDPYRAAWIANAVANAYVEDQLDSKFDATKKATLWLSNRISELSRQAQLADTAVQQYKAEHNITTTANGTSVVEQQIADINSQLILARTDLAEKQSNYGRLSEMAKVGRASDSAQVLASPLIATLRSQETVLNGQMADLSNKYGPRHPKILDMQAQKSNLDTKINEEVQRVVVSKKNEVEAAQAHVSSLQQSLQQLETQGAGQNKAEVQLTALQSAATSSRSMYEAFLGRLNQSQGREGIQAPDARVISNAEVPVSPSYPQTVLVIGLSIPAGLLLGFALAFGAERLDAGFRTTSQLEGLLGVPVLATVPEVLGTEKGVITNATDFILDRPTSSFAEAVRGLQLGIGLSRIDDPPKVIIVTSSVPGEGKTTLAVSLARMAARSGKKTVIVDGDLRRPTLAKVIGGEYQNGIVEVLLDKLPLDQCLGRDPRSNVYVLPCLVAPASPADILASDAMANLVKNLEQCFDLVIIDSAPVLPVNDTKILSRLADAVLFVVRWERTPREATASAMRALTDAHAKVVGVALSRADSERFRYYSYGYQSYSSYSKYYGE